MLIPMKLLSLIFLTVAVILFQGCAATQTSAAAPAPVIATKPTVSARPADRAQKAAAANPAPAVTVTPAAAPQSYQRVTLDRFFAGQTASMPLSLEIPAAYVHAEGLEIPDTYSYWMQEQDVAAVVKTQDLPARSGYIYGKVSLDVGFDKTTGKFTSEDKFEADMAEAGMKVMEKKRFDVKGYPVLASILKAKDGTIVCSMYLGMLIETNALYFGYIPPRNNLATGRAVWNHLLESIRQD